MTEPTDNSMIYKLSIPLHVALLVQAKIISAFQQIIMVQKCGEDIVLFIKYRIKIKATNCFYGLVL
jgi:hypothetical protein